MSATLIVEAGDGANPNANSYISLEAANAFLGSRLHVDEWDNADTDQRKRGLIMATQSIDAAAIFRGYKKLQPQPLQWPRVRVPDDNYGGSIFAPGLGIAYRRVYYDENSLPLILVQATAIQALELLRGDRTTDQGAPGISSLGLGQGALSIDFNSATNPLSVGDEPKRLLGCLVSGFRGRGSTKRTVRVQ